MDARSVFFLGWTTLSNIATFQGFGQDHLTEKEIFAAEDCFAATNKHDLVHLAVAGDTVERQARRQKTFLKPKFLGMVDGLDARSVFSLCLVDVLDAESVFHWAWLTVWMLNQLFHVHG